MTNNDSSPWNDQARIACSFKFKCPKLWHLLQPTAVEGVRHCPECDRDVHLALTEDEFRRHSEQGLCIAVPVLRPERRAEPETPAYVLGRAESPYNAFLRRLP